MARTSLLGGLLLLAALASPAAELSLRTAHDSEAEKQTVAQLQRLLQHGGGKGIVHAKQTITGLRNAAYRRNVRYLQRRIGGRFQPY